MPACSLPDCFRSGIVSAITRLGSLPEPFYKKLVHMMITVEEKFEPVLARLGVKERTKLEKHLATCDAEADGTHGTLWRKVAGTLGQLAPLAMQSVGNNAWRFFVADGKYRMQVFAIEDSMDGVLRIYLPDILTEAVKTKILDKTSTPKTFAVNGGKTQMEIDSLGVAEAASAPPHYQHMLGWNRKALRVSISTAKMDDALDKAIESLAQLAAKRFAVAPVKAAAT
jgi:hypothetical protein